MGTTITFRRGENDPTSGSGLTLAEPAFNTTLKTFHIGLGHGITAAWVGAPISGLSADIAAGITYKTPTLKAVKDYVTDYVTAVNGVLTVNGFAGGVTLNAGTALGLTSSSGNITLTNLGVQSFNGLTGAVQGVSSWNGQTGAVSFVNYVASFNGLTGVVGGVTTSVANTFVPMQSFSAGISAAGGTFTQRTVFTSGIQSGGITASTVTSEGTSTIPGYPGYYSITTVSADTIKFVFDGVGGQILRPTDDNIDGSTRTNYLPASSGTLALTSQLMGAVNGSTAATTAVTSFNGLTGAVGGVTTSAANTFTAVQTFNSGVTFASTIDATGAARLSGGLTASRIDVTGNFKVVGDAQIGDQNTDTLTVFSGTTFNNRVDFGGTNFFRYGLTSGGAIRFSGNNTKTIITSEASLVISGSTSGPIASAYNSMVFGVQTTDPLTMYSATGVVDIATNNPLTAVQPALRFNTDDLDIIGPGSIKIEPVTYATAARTQYLQDASGTLALTSQLMGAVNGSTAATTAVTSFNGLTGAVTGVTVGGVNTFTQVNTFSAGISAAGSTFASTTNTLDVIASTEGAGLRIARATSGVGSRIGGIRFGRSATSSQNTYIEGSSGTFNLYNGVDNTGTLFAAFSPSQFSLGTTSAAFITFNCPNNISLGDSNSVGNSQQFSISGTNRTYAFGDPTGVTTGFVGINRSGLCGDYALEVNSPTGKGLQLIYNDHTGAASNWVNMDVSSGGNFTVRPSGGLATVTGTLNVSAGLCAAGITLSANGKIEADGGVLYIGNNPVSTTRVVVGDFDASGNSTYILVRDPVSALDIINPFGAARMGDPDGINNGAYFTVDNGSGTAEIAAGDFTVNALTIVNGLLKPSSGISASGGVTFGGTVASDTGYRITSNAINAQTGTTYTFLDSDNGKVVTFNNGSAVTVTIPTALPVGFNCTAIQLGAGQVGFTAASGVTLQSYGSQYRLIGQHASASIIEYSTNIVNLSGNLVV